MMLPSSGFQKIETSALLFVLLTPLLTVQVQASESVKTAETAVLSEGNQPEKSVNENNRRQYFLPRWPENKQLKREVIPPAPPGPYMSSALSSFSIKGPTFDNHVRNQDRKQKWRRLRNDGRAADAPLNQAGGSEAPMTTFSPDIPWPSTTASPQRWQPEDGYRFVKPVATKKPYPMNMPVMNWSGSRLPDGMRLRTQRTYPDQRYVYPRSTESRNNAAKQYPYPARGAPSPSSGRP